MSILVFLSNGEDRIEFKTVRQEERERVCDCKADV